MKIVIGINTLTDVNASIYRNHLLLFFGIGKWAQIGGHEVILVAPHRFSIDHMRNTCARIALEQDCKYVFFLDDDVAINAFSLDLLIERIEQYNADIMCGLTFVRSFPFGPMLYENISECKFDIKLKSMFNYKEKMDSNNIVKCDAIGFSCALLRTETLKRVDAPYFVTGPFNTEDIYYCCKLYQESEVEPLIYCDTKIKCKHLLEPESVSEQNVEDLRVRYGVFSGVRVSNPDRGEEYLKEVEEEINK